MRYASLVIHRRVQWSWMRLPCQLAVGLAVVFTNQFAFSQPLQNTTTRVPLAESPNSYSMEAISEVQSTRLASLPFGSTSVYQPLAGIRSNGVLANDFQLQAIGQNNRGQYLGYDPKGKLIGKDGQGQTIIYHQPLVQVKLRIAEIVREDNFAAKTVLDYVRDKGNASLAEAHKINKQQGSTTSTRFQNTGALIGPENLSGNGGLINLTSNQLNLIGQFLATEFSADLITCPQVVTLNGQTVQLMSGANVPFTLGQSVLQDGTLAIQETFYKHVGTNLTVTPRIVNWGPRGEGLGESPIMVQKVKDWNAVASMMSLENLLGTDKAKFAPYVGNQLLMPTQLQSELLQILNTHSKRDIVQLLSSRHASSPNYRYPLDLLFHPLDCEQMNGNGCPCNWNPSDCTLDIELVLRQSKRGASEVADLKLASSNPTRVSINLESEEIGAAIANVVQLKNGQGAVIAGLIGERDIKTTSKIPVLGDIPWIGAAFRSKLTNRQKTEIVVFLEAEILPSESYDAVSQASMDFALTKGYVASDILCNPLELGMQRAGFGSYLPPRSHHEKIYWERLGRKVQKSCTVVEDILH